MSPITHTQNRSIVATAEACVPSNDVTQPSDLPHAELAFAYIT